MDIFFFSNIVVAPVVLQIDTCDLLADWLAGSSAGCLACYMAGLAAWLADWLPSLLSGCLLPGWPAAWLAGAA